MMKRLGLILGFLSAACSSGALPDLPPAATEDRPSRVQILGVWPAEGERELRPPELPVGRAYLLKVRVSALGELPLDNEPLVASIESSSFERVISFPRGNSCLTPSSPSPEEPAGICKIVFFSEGPVRDVEVIVRAQRELSVSDSISLDLRADLDRPKLLFRVPGVGTALWAPGESDPLVPLKPMPLSLEDSEPAAFVVELKDTFGNPLVARQVELMSWVDPAEEPISVEDGGIGSDTGHGSDGGAGDSGSRQLRDGGARFDSGLVGDVGIDDSIAPEPSELADGRVVVHRFRDGACTAEVQDTPIHVAATDALGRVTFCLSAGDSLGAWRLVVRAIDTVNSDDIAARTQDGFVLSGRTRAGDPARIILIGHDQEGDEPLSRCESGDVTPLEYFQVLSQQGRPVVGAEVEVRIEGAIRLLSFARPVTDENGRIAVQASCPLTMPNRSTIYAELTDESINPLNRQARLYVRLEVQRIERIRLMVDEPGQSQLDIGRAQALQPMYFKVVAEGSRGTPAVNSRLNLKVLTSQPSNGLYFLSGTDCREDQNQIVHGQSVYTNADGMYRFAVCGVGLSTILRPMVLVVQAHQQITQLNVPITLLAGAPDRVLFDPPGRVSTVVGGAAGAIQVVVQDTAGNGVSGVDVALTVPDEVIVSVDSGRTNAVGRWSAWVTRVDQEGEFELIAQVTKGEWTSSAALNIVAVQEAATRISWYDGDRLLLPVRGAVQVDVPVGEALSVPVRMRLENRLGGGIAGEGIAFALNGGDPDQCGRVAIAGRITDERGDLVLGGDTGIELAAGPLTGDCLWQVRAGNAVQSLLRVRQTAGDPYGGRPEVDQGTELLALQTPPTDWNQAVPMVTSVRVRATDRLGNIKSGLGMWLNATNCWIESPFQRLDDQGEGVWRVAGGRDHNAPCTLHMRYPGGEWQDAQPLTIPLSGFPVPEIQSIDRLAREASWYRDCPRGSYFRANGCYFRGGHVAMSGQSDTSHHLVLRIADELLIRPDELRVQLAGTCFEQDLDDPYVHCSRIEILSVEESNDRARVYTTIGTLPIRWRVVRPDWNANRALEFYIELPQRLVADGRIKALRVVQPDGQTVGPAAEFFIQPPVRWDRQTTRVVSPDNQEELVRLWGGHRLQLDNDQAQEAVFCGNDDRGGILAVIDPQDVGESYPESLVGIRLWSMVEDPKMPSASRSELGCALGDLDDDGRDDLVIPLPTNQANRVPRLMMLRGTPQAPFFDVDNAVTVLLNDAPAYPAYPPSQVAVSSEPNRIWVCFGAIDGSGSQQGTCTHDGALSVFVQSSPFTDQPNLALGVQLQHPQWPILQAFQTADQVYFEGLGTVDSQSRLIGQTQPWPEQPLTQDTGTLAATYFDEAERVITTVSSLGLVRRWNHHGAQLNEFMTPDEVASAVFSQDGRLAASVVANQIYVWRTSDGTELFSVPGDIAHWTATNLEFPDPVLIAADRVENRNCHHTTQTQVDVRTYTQAGELIREIIAAHPQVTACASHNVWTLAGTPGAEMMYIHKHGLNTIERWNGRTGLQLDDFTIDQLTPALPNVAGRSLGRLYFNADASQALARVTLRHTANHTLLLAMPSGQTLWQTCVGNAGTGCSHHLNQGRDVYFSPDGRLIASNELIAYNANDPGQWRGSLYDPTDSVRWSGFSSQSSYATMTETQHAWVESRRSAHVTPIDTTPGGVHPISYSSPELISGQSKRPAYHHSQFNFGVHLVRQERDDGDVMLLPRRAYRDGLTNQYYDDNAYGGQWGYPDAHAGHQLARTMLGDGQIIVARPETWRAGCGNGILDPGELVDPGQPWNGRWDCGASIAATCGDGVLDVGEECDDGNADVDDACAGCLETHPGWRQDQPVLSCENLPENADSGTYWLGPRSDAVLGYCMRANATWYRLAARFANDDELRWRGINWTAAGRSFGTCGSLVESGLAHDCRAEVWDTLSTQELLVVERLERNGQVYSGSRIFGLDQARTLHELANLPEGQNVLNSTQRLEGGDDMLAFATMTNPPHLLVNYDLGNDGCHLATTTNSGQCTSGLGCRTNNRNYHCYGDVNTDQFDNMGWQDHGEQPAWLRHTVHLLVREQSN